MPHHAVLASTGKLYITYNNQGGPYDGDRGDVWKYDTATSVWTKITPDPSSSTNYWFGYGGIAVDAQNPDTLVVAELNRWWPDVNLWRSTDGGRDLDARSGTGDRGPLGSSATSTTSRARPGSRSA